MSSWIQGSVQWNDQMIKSFTEVRKPTPSPIAATPVPTLPPTSPPTMAPTLPPLPPMTMAPTVAPTVAPTMAPTAPPPPPRMPRYDTGGVVFPLPVAPDLLLGGDISMLNPVTGAPTTTPAPTTAAPTTTPAALTALPKKEEEKKSFWTWKVILVTILCLAILAAAGYVVYRRYKGAAAPVNTTDGLKNLKKNNALGNTGGGLNAISNNNLNNINANNTNNTNGANNNFVNNNIGPPPPSANGKSKK